MDRKEICALLDAEGIPYTLAEHPAAMTVADIERIGLPHREAGAKALFLRDDKKRTYYLAVVRDDRQADLRAIGEKAGTRRLSFASEEDLWRILRLRRGSVTPFGALNDACHIARVLIEKSFMQGWIWVHPNENTASLYLRTADLVRLLEQRGTDVTLMDL